MDSYIIAVDPGKMTGWAQLRNGEFSSGEAELFDFLAWLSEVLDRGLRPIIIAEDFIITQQTIKKSRQHWSIEGIGVMRFLSMFFDCDFVIQTPAEAKQFSTDEKLKAIAWYVPGKGHANDAARHLLRYAVANDLVPLSALV